MTPPVVCSMVQEEEDDIGSHGPYPESVFVGRFIGEFLNEETFFRYRDETAKTGEGGMVYAHTSRLDSNRLAGNQYLFISTMRASIIGHFKTCMTDIYLHI